MVELSIKKAKEYLAEHPVTFGLDEKQQGILTEVFIDAFSKGYRSGIDDYAEMLNSMLMK